MKQPKRRSRTQRRRERRQWEQNHQGGTFRDDMDYLDDCPLCRGGPGPACAWHFL